MLWSREQRKEEDKNTPGPGFYRAESAARALIKHAAAFSFTSADTGRKVNHSTAGAVPPFASAAAVKRSCQQLCQYCIAADTITALLLMLVIKECMRCCCCSLLQMGMGCCCYSSLQTECAAAVDHHYQWHVLLLLFNMTNGMCCCCHSSLHLAGAALQRGGSIQCWLLARIGVVPPELLASSLPAVLHFVRIQTCM